MYEVKKIPNARVLLYKIGLNKPIKLEKIMRNI